MLPGWQENSFALYYCLISKVRIYYKQYLGTSIIVINKSHNYSDDDNKLLEKYMHDVSGRLKNVSCNFGSLVLGLHFLDLSWGGGLPHIFLAPKSFFGPLDHHKKTAS